MSYQRVLVAFTLAVYLTGCAVAPKKPKLVPVSAVINSVKDELQFVSDHAPPFTKPAPPNAQCTGPNHVNSVVLKPQAVKVTLKTVATTELDPSVGLVNPIGVISIDPSYSGSYSKSDTQSLEVDLTLPEPKNAKAEMLNVTSAQMNAHPLAQAIIAFAQELLNVDHTKTPCLKPGTLSATATFDVVNTSTGGLSLNLWIIKVGDKTAVTDEAHQTIEIDYDLNGSTQLAPQ